jgi:multiple sugar transport system permease protein
MVLGLLIAVLFNQPLPYRRIVLSLFIIPTMLAPVVVGLIWRFIFYPQYGILSVFLNKLGLFTEVTIFSKPGSALTVILLVDIWEWTPFLGLVFLSGLMSLPQEPFEAARIDGASDFQLFTKVTIPMLKPLLFVGFIFRLIDAIKIFDIVYILTFGGPGGTTEVVNLYIYRLNFKYWNLGYGAAPAVLIVFLMFLIATFIFLFWGIYEKRKKRIVIQTKEKI